MNPARLLPVIAAVVLLAGCGERPHAPPLVREPTYRNARTGLTLTPPPGWLMQSRTEPPPGPLPRPKVLVSYLSPKADRAMFEVEVANPVPDADVEKFLTDNPIGGQKWGVKEKRTATTAGGLAAVRLAFSYPGQKGEIVREVTVVQRADLTVFFVTTCYGSDQPARDAMRRAVDTVSWE